MRILAALALLLLPSCLATAGDIQAIADRVGMVEVAAQEGTPLELEAALAELRATSLSVAQNVRERGASLASAAASSWPTLLGQVMQVAVDSRRATVVSPTPAALAVMGERMDAIEKEAEDDISVPEGLGGAALAAAGLYKAINMARDKKYVVMSSASTDPRAPSA